MSIRDVSNGTFFFNDTATTEIYTLSLHDALPISSSTAWWAPPSPSGRRTRARSRSSATSTPGTVACRSEEHTSELQSPDHLVCRLLLEKKRTRLPPVSVHIPGTQRK